MNYAVIYPPQEAYKNKIRYEKPFVFGITQIGCANCDNEELTSDLQGWKCSKCFGIKE